LTAFGASFRGREVAGAPPLDPARIRQIGLMIASRQAGAFSLAIRQISLDSDGPSHVQNRMARRGARGAP
jgi:hypothetical protein